MTIIRTRGPRDPFALAYAFVAMLRDSLPPHHLLEISTRIEQKFSAIEACEPFVTDPADVMLLAWNALWGAGDFNPEAETDMALWSAGWRAAAAVIRDRGVLR
jgi:hypothetical protein